MESIYKENGDKLYDEGKFAEAFLEYKKMLTEEGLKINPHFNNRLLACSRKSKDIENYLYVFDLMTEMKSDYFDLETHSIEDFKNINATTYLWLLYDLIKEDDFNVNLYLQEVLNNLDYCADRNSYCYYLAKVLFKNEATNKKLLQQFVEFVDYKQYSKEIQYQDGKALASEHEQLGYSIGKFYQEIGEYERSNAICAELLTLDPNISKYRGYILNLQADNYLALKDFNTALKKKHQALEVKDEWYLYSQIGLIYLELNKTNQAGKYFTLALFKNRQNFGFLNKLLLDLQKVYLEIGEEELVKLLNSILYYERKKNNWSIGSELESAEKYNITELNFRKYYFDFQKKCKDVLIKRFLESKKEGVINMFNKEKRFGFILDKGGKPHHFSPSAIIGNPRDLFKNDKVYFELKEKLNLRKNIRETTCEYVIKI